MASPLRVVLIGVESTGKTTLAKALAEKLHTVWVPEYGREYTEIKYAAGDNDWSDLDFVKIAEEQLRLELEALTLANQVLIADTDAVATCVWTERYMGHRVAAVEEIGARSLPDLYLLTLPDFPFVPDDIRDGEAIREWMHELFIARLEEIKVPYAVLGGSHERRLTCSLEAMHDLAQSRGIALSIV